MKAILLLAIIGAAGACASATTATTVAAADAADVDDDPSWWVDPTARDVLRDHFATVRDAGAITATLLESDEVTVRRGPVLVPPDEAAALAQLLTDDNSFAAPGPPSACKVRYRFVLHVVREVGAGSEAVDLAFCLGCSHVSVRHNGVSVGGANTAPVAGRLRQAAQSLFVGDEDLAGF